MSLQILVNRYNEPEYIVARFLESIAMQIQACDFEVVIGDDGSDVPLSASITEWYPFTRIIEYPHRGVCATRNALLDQSTADYLMFCDIDDTFTSTIGLNAVSNAMATKCDVFTSTFLIESRDKDGNFRDFVRMHEDVYFIHGKAFRREYLIENGIRWADEMVTNGDEVFLWQAMYMTPNIVYSREPFYAWRWNPNSVCRSEQDHFEKSYTKSLRSYELLIDTLLDRGVNWLALLHAVSMVYDAYCMMNRRRWLELAGSDFVNEAEDRLVHLVGKYSQLFSLADEKVCERAWDTKKRNYILESPESPKGLLDWYGGVADRVRARRDEECGGDALCDGRDNEGRAP